MSDEDDDYSYVSPQGRIVGTLVPIERIEAARKEERERVLQEIEALLDEQRSSVSPHWPMFSKLERLVCRLREGP